MPATQTKAERGGDADPLEQIRDLREQVESLMRDRVKPILAEAADRAEDVAHQASGVVRDEAEALANRVRERPLSALLIAAAAGYLLGRITR
jgi:ElaB/YqjD/DUF883 family membrane-anchored ribosome-binding protein